jgi:hypothetical protein
MAREAESNLAAMGGQQAAAAKRVQGVASSVDIKVKVSNTSSVPFALAAVWGAKRRTGWYAQAKYAQRGGVAGRVIRRALGRHNNGQQFKPWVGSSWQVGERGEGPYGLNDAIASKIDEAVDAQADGIENLMNTMRG